MRKMECQLCEEEYRRAESKFILCPDCATETMIIEARNLRVNLSLAKTSGLPATLTLQQWITTLDYFAWKCAYRLEQPNKVMEHFIPISMRGDYQPYAALVGGQPLKTVLRLLRLQWKKSNRVERGMFPTMEMIERIPQYLQINLNNLPMPLYVKKNLHS